VADGKGGKTSCPYFEYPLQLGKGEGKDGLSKTHISHFNVVISKRGAVTPEYGERTDAEDNGAYGRGNLHT
jgi:hypothetical protein